jgi:transcription elongation factor Elf1
MITDFRRPEPIMTRPPSAVQRGATCPLCHAIEASVSDEALAAGGGWRCTICGQRWDAPRLATVAAYAVWARERETMSKANRQP